MTTTVPRSLSRIDGHAPSMRDHDGPCVVVITHRRIRPATRDPDVLATVRISHPTPTVDA
jgi:hypothetical protein